MLSPDFKLFQANKVNAQNKRSITQSDQSEMKRNSISIDIRSKSPTGVKVSDLLIETTFDNVENDSRSNQNEQPDAKALRENSTRLKKRKHASNPSTPSRKSSNVVGMMSSLKKKGGKIIRNLTPPRHLHIGIQTPQRQRQRQSCLKRNNSASYKDIDCTSPCDLSPKALTLSSRFESANDYTIRSCEIDPSPFQLDIPSHESVLVHCKICCMLENYFDIGGFDFDFSSLMPWVSKNSKPGDPHVLTSSQNRSNQEDEKVSQVLKALLEIVDDIIVEGFFREFYMHKNGENGLARIEACVLSSCKLRRFIVCYRCSSDLQDRPLQGINRKRCKEKPTGANTCKCPDDKDSSGELSNESKCLTLDQRENLVLDDVNDAFLKVFHSTKVQGNLNTLLSRLTSLKPFYDVAITGHSFSGGLATLSSYFYALNHPATRVYCHVFGSPIVGGSYFRDQVHSLPNLNLIRIERSTDPFVNLPEINSSNANRGSQNDIGTKNKSFSSMQSNWIHVGHCLRLTPTNSLTISDETKRPVEIKLYRYDKLRPTNNFIQSSLRSVSNLKKLKIGNEINSYKKDLEKIEKLNIVWVDSFQGMTEKIPSSSGVFA